MDNPKIDNSTDQSNKEICKNEFLIDVHYFIIFVLNAIRIIAIKNPKRNVSMLTKFPSNGTKNPITVEATRILEISEKYFASSSS